MLCWRRYSVRFCAVRDYMFPYLPPRKNHRFMLDSKSCRHWIAVCCADVPLSNHSPTHSAPADGRVGLAQGQLVPARAVRRTRSIASSCWAPGRITARSVGGKNVNQWAAVECQWSGTQRMMSIFIITYIHQQSAEEQVYRMSSTTVSYNWATTTCVFGIPGEAFYTGYRSTGSSNQNA